MQVSYVRKPLMCFSVQTLSFKSCLKRCIMFIIRWPHKMLFTIRYRIIISVMVLILNGYSGSIHFKSSNDKSLKTSSPIYLDRTYSKLFLPKMNIKEPVNITIVSKNLKISKVDDKEWTITNDIRSTFLSSFNHLI